MFCREKLRGEFKDSHTPDFIGAIRPNALVIEVSDLLFLASREGKRISGRESQMCGLRSSHHRGVYLVFLRDITEHFSFAARGRNT